MSRKIEIIENINNAHCDIFLRLEERLRNHNIESIEEAEKLSKKAERFGDIETADIDLVWGELWNKPLYSYTNEKNGEKWRKQLEKFGIQNGSARIDIAMDPQKILGLKEKGVVDAAEKRLRAIYTAAKHLTELQERKNSRIVFPTLRKSCSKKESMKLIIESLQKSLGKGWGPITVLHFFTDIGISIKPDLHVARTLEYIGISDFLGEIDESYRPNIDECIDIHFAVLAMNKALQERSSHYTLRYIDKVLMNISRDGLLSD